MSHVAVRSPEALTKPRKPAWDVAALLPSQGEWTEDEYLFLPTNRLVEFSDGRLEVLPVPTRLHQKIVAYLYKLLAAYVEKHGSGEVFFAALPVRLRPGKWREPDVIFVRAENKKALEGEFLYGADLVMEVVSNKNRNRDLILKRREYALAGIPEYWIVDPQRQTIMVLRLKGKAYVVHGEYRKGQHALSAHLSGFEVNVEKAFDQA